MSGRGGSLVLAAIILWLSEFAGPALRLRGSPALAAPLPSRRPPGRPRDRPPRPPRRPRAADGCPAGAPARAGLPRRELLALHAPPLAAGLAALASAPSGAAAATAAVDVTAGSGLRARILRQSYEELTSPIFNIPPGRTAYPDWLEGTWLANQTFAGAVFPTLPRQSVMREEDVPGFKTCSVIDFADIGKSPVQYEVRWVRSGGSVVEDLPFNLPSTVSAHLDGKGKVTNVQYMPEKDANRISVAVSGSKNADRVELFVNSRVSEAPQDAPNLFFASEYRRQVTFSSRVVQGFNGNYQHFRSFKRVGPNTVRLNVLTASYVDPLSPQYFQTFDKPVIVFSHDVTLSRV